MLKQYFSVCWFTGDPAELQISKSFLWKCLIFYLGAGILIQANITDPAEALIQVFIELLITILFIGFLLMLKKSLGHFERMTTAFIFSECFYYLLVFPVAIWYTVVKETAQDIYPIFVAAFLTVWFCAIISYILKGILSSRLWASIFLSITYFAITYLGSFGLILML